MVAGASIASVKNTYRLDHALLLGANFSIGSVVYTGVYWTIVTKLDLVHDIVWCCQPYLGIIKHPEK